MDIRITESTDFNKPSAERPHPVNPEGIQYLWRFKNGFGASVIQFKDEIIKTSSFSGSYTNNKDEYELAVLKFDKSGDYTLTYKTKITDDVIGHLKIKDVEKILRKIKKIEEGEIYV